MQYKPAKTTNSRRVFLQRLALAAGAAPLLCRGAGIDAAPHPPRFGLFMGNVAAHLEAFLAELGKLGFVDGENVVIEKRVQHELADAPAMARELATLPLDFIVVAALPFALMVRKENPHMPMVITTCPGMISNGFARSFEHPGGIYTGLEELPPGVTAKRLTLLKTAVASARRVALLSTTPGVGGHETQLEDATRAAYSLGVHVKTYRATTPEEIDGALAAIVADRMDALLNFQGGMSLYRRQAIVEFAAAQRLPAIYQSHMFTDAGGLMAWSPDQVEQQRVAARLTARVLRGTSPGDLPVAYAPNYSLSINAGTAHRLGLILQAGLLSQAAQVIE